MSSLIDEDYNTYRLKYSPDWGQAGDAVVGQGGFGVVFTHKIRRPGMLRTEVCAVKRIPKTHMFPQELYQREISIFCRLVKHEWFLQFFAWHEDAINLYIIMENIDLGDLGKYIDQPWLGTDASVVAEQLLQGLQVLHKEGITHRDLKPANIFPILLTDSPTLPILRIKLGDFGISKRVGLNGTTALYTSVGTYSYAAPEVFSQQSQYSSSVDMWSLGCVLFRLVAGHDLFATLDDVMKFKYTQQVFQRDWVPGGGDAFADFLVGLIECDPTKRPTSWQAAQHRWVRACPEEYHISEGLRKRLVRSTAQEEVNSQPNSLRSGDSGYGSNRGPSPVPPPPKSPRPPPPPLPRRSSRDVTASTVRPGVYLQQKPGGTATLYPPAPGEGVGPEAVVKKVFREYLSTPKPPVMTPEQRTAKIKEEAQRRMHQRLATLGLSNSYTKLTELPSAVPEMAEEERWEKAKGALRQQGAGLTPGPQWKKVMGEPIFLSPFTTDTPVLDIPNSTRLWHRTSPTSHPKVRAKCLGLYHGRNNTWVHLRIGPTARIVICKSHLSSEDQQWLNHNGLRCNPSHSTRTPLHHRTWIDRSGGFQVEAEFLAYYPYPNGSVETSRLSSLLLQYGTWGDFLLKGPIWREIAEGLVMGGKGKVEGKGGTVFIRKTNGVMITVPTEKMSLKDIEYIEARIANIYMREIMELPPGTTTEQRDMIYGDGVPDGPGLTKLNPAISLQDFGLLSSIPLPSFPAESTPSPSSAPPKRNPFKVQSSTTPATTVFPALPDYSNKKWTWTDKRQGQVIPPSVLVCLRAGYALPGVRAGYALPEVILEGTRYPSVGDRFAVRLCNLKLGDVKYVEKVTGTDLEDYYDLEPEGPPYTTVKYGAASEEAGPGSFSRNRNRVLG